MSNLTDEELKRIRQVRWAALGENFANFEAKKDDVRLLAVRLDTMELADHAVSEEMLRWVLERLKEDRQSQREWLADLVEQCRVAELQALEADEAVKAVEALVGGGMHINGDAIIKRWDAVAEDYKRRGLLPADPEPAPPPDPEPPKVAAAPATPTVPAPTPPTPRPSVDPLAERIMAMLEPMAAAHGQYLDAAKVAEYLDEPASRVRSALHALSDAGRLQYLRRLDQSQAVVLPVGEVLEPPTLTDKQRSIFDALVSFADEDWHAMATLAQIGEKSGSAPGSVSAHLWTLERKGYIVPLNRGAKGVTGAYEIAGVHRIARPAPAPAVVMSDADLDAYARQAIKASMN